MSEDERGTCREALRADVAPLFDDLHFGRACGDGWRAILRDLTTAIAQIVGGPDREPGLRVTQVKEKYGTLRVYVSGLPALHSDAVEAAILAAEIRSGEVCEVCGAEGLLRESSGGWWHAACDDHAMDRSEEPTSELQSLMRSSSDVLCLKT